MASFLGAFRKMLGAGAGVGQLAAPYVSLFNPAAGAIVASVSRAIIRAESEYSEPKSGPLKQAAVIADFKAGLDVAKDILAAQGKTITYDNGALEDAIKAQVMAFNAFNALKASVKIVDAKKE